MYTHQKLTNQDKTVLLIPIRAITQYLREIFSYCAFQNSQCESHIAQAIAFIREVTYFWIIYVNS